MPLIATFYLDRRSPVHRAHPRIKLVASLVAFVAIICFNDPRYQLAIFVAILLLGALARLTPFELLGRVRPVLVIAVIIAAAWALFGPAGTPVWQFWIFHVTGTSILYGIAAGIRVVSLALTFFFVLETTEQADVLYGLVSLGMPYPFAFIIASIFRFAPTISGEGETIREAQRARGMDFSSGSIFTRIQKSMSFVIPLLVRVLKTTVDLSLAIASKAYGAYPKRTSFRQRAMTSGERMLMVLLPAIAAACILARVLGYGALVPGTL
ncbi:MAG: cobalt transport protein [Microbacteriaceae bacterium]|nr:cobalt transport protein [Microbacteriaceae bacterium]